MNWDWRKYLAGLLTGLIIGGLAWGFLICAGEAIKYYYGVR